MFIVPVRIEVKGKLQVEETGDGQSSNSYLPFTGQKKHRKQRRQVTTAATKLRRRRRRRRYVCFEYQQRITIFRNIHHHTKLTIENAVDDEKQDQSSIIFRFVIFAGNIVIAFAIPCTGKVCSASRGACAV